MVRRGAKCGREIALASTGLAGMALLFAVVVVSGRSYGHYLLMFVPLYVVALNAAVFQIRRAVGNRAAYAVLLIGRLKCPFEGFTVSDSRESFCRAEVRGAVVSELQVVVGQGDVLAVGNECWVYLDGGFRASVPFAYRSDVMPEAYDAWLSSLIASDSAPSAIVVADYVELAVPLEPYREVATLEGFTIYGR